MLVKTGDTTPVEPETMNETESHTARKAEILKEAAEGASLTIHYDSAHSDDVQAISGEILSAGMSWNGELVEVEFKNDDGIYTVRMDEETGTGRLERNQYDWQNGDRVSKTGSRRITQWNDPDAIKRVELAGHTPTYACWYCGEEFDREADRNAHEEFDHVSGDEEAA